MVVPELTFEPRPSTVTVMACPEVVDFVFTVLSKFHLDHKAQDQATPSATTASTGQTLRHAPQRVQTAGSMRCGRLAWPLMA
jgi:hypothetical protein